MRRNLRISGWKTMTRAMSPMLMMPPSIWLQNRMLSMSNMRQAMYMISSAQKMRMMLVPRSMRYSS